MIDSPIETAPPSPPPPVTITNKDSLLPLLEAGDDTYQAVHSLWDDALDFSEPDSEDEEDEEEEDEEQD